jgi:hypothetical protein
MQWVQAKEHYSRDKGGSQSVLRARKTDSDWRHSCLKDERGVL